jgi:hypothetical protein
MLNTPYICVKHMYSGYHLSFGYCRPLQKEDGLKTGKCPKYSLFRVLSIPQILRKELPVDHLSPSKSAPFFEFHNKVQYNSEIKYSQASFWNIPALVFEDQWGYTLNNGGDNQ